jgi:septal ring factor EnvC (AmiA/AmiB activator)
MRDGLTRTLRRVLAIFLILPPFHLAAAEPQKELEGIKKKIEAERSEIRKTQKKEGSVLQSLEKIDGELERKSKELKRIDARLEFYTADLQRKELEAKRVHASLKTREELLHKRARAFYKWHRGGTPLIFLNGHASIAELLRRKRYLEITLNHDHQLVSHYLREAARYEGLRAEVAGKSRDLDNARKALVAVKEEIRVEREKKREVLVSLRREKEARGQAIKELEQAALRLQKMIDEMSRRGVAAPRSQGAGFEGLKGDLEYPVRGEVIGEFGKVRHPDFSAELFRKGIDIEAPLGEEVKAVEAGTVVFADRFSGYGKMIILDHGQRYYTVYAHLSEISKATGQAVGRGERIGSVGDSDSLKGSRLYFEIRKDGKPLDPLTWLKRR